MFPSWLPFALAALTLWGVWGFLAKVADGFIPATASTAWQGVGGLAVIFALAVWARPDVTVDTRGILAAAAGGAALWIGIFAFSTALAAGGRAGLVVPMTGLYPVVTVVLGVLILGERLRVPHVAGLAFAVAAVVLLSQ